MFFNPCYPESCLSNRKGYIIEFTCCSSPLSPELLKQAQATTAVTAVVVALVVSGSVAGAVGGAVGGSAASSAAPGASVYQLINAAQFMNIFGTMLSPGQGTGSITGGSRRVGNNAATNQSIYTDESNFTVDVTTTSSASEFRFVDITATTSQGKIK